MSRFVCTLVLALSTGTAFAGDDGPKGLKPEKLDRMARELSLNADQKGKVKAILEAEHAKKQALRDETRDKLKAVLTAAQFAKLDSKK